MILQPIIERLYDLPVEKMDRDDALQIVGQLKEALNSGEARAAEPLAARWIVNTWVKKGILLAFRLGKLSEASGSMSGSQFFDKDTMALSLLFPMKLQDFSLTWFGYV